MAAWNVELDVELGLTWAARGARVVARIRRRGLGYEQLAGPCGTLRDDVDATALRVIHDPLALVPVDERWRHRRLHRQAGEIDVAAALDEELRVAQDLGPWHCRWEVIKSHTGQAIN